MVYFFVCFIKVNLILLILIVYCIIFIIEVDCIFIIYHNTDNHFYYNINVNNFLVMTSMYFCDDVHIVNIHNLDLIVVT